MQHINGSNRKGVTIWAQEVQGDSGNNNIKGSVNGDLIYGNDGNDTLDGEGGIDTIYGGNGNDYITGGEGSNLLDGGNGDDTIYGGWNGNDTIYASNGNDSLLGDGGDDTYIVDMTKNLSGITMINDSNSSSNNDTIKFIGVSDSDIIVTGEALSRSSGGNVIRIKFNDNENYQVLVQNADSSSKIENFIFDNTTYTYNEIVEEYLTVQQVNGYGTTNVTPWAEEVQGDNGANRINGRNTDFGDLIYGNGGDDNICGYAGNDTIYGGDNNDYLMGENGDDYLVGGSGNDSLSGGNGNDTFVFTSGDGNDELWDYSGNDKIIINNVSTDGVAFFRENNNLIIKYTDNDTITIENQFIPNEQIEQIELDNGKYMTSSNIDYIIQQINAYATENNIQLSNVDSIRNNDELMQLVTSGWQS